MNTFIDTGLGATLKLYKCSDAWGIYDYDSRINYASRKFFMTGDDDMQALPIEYNQQILSFVMIPPWEHVKLLKLTKEIATKNRLEVSINSLRAKQEYYDYLIDLHGGPRVTEESFGIDDRSMTSSNVNSLTNISAALGSHRSIAGNSMLQSSKPILTTNIKKI